MVTASATRNIGAFVLGGSLNWLSRSGEWLALRSARAMAFAFCVLIAAPGLAEAQTKTLKLYFTHTKERAEITFMRNGRYDQAGLTKLNRFLRDWRRNEPTKMDPKLFELLWEVYRQSGSRDYIHVVSAYRSPATNAMLKRTRGGQATKSQHMVGKAIDFFLPDVKVSKLRSIALRLQAGGVGYYPSSGSPFVHIDTGSVRHWPRMTRQQLVSVFPNGGTLHVPSDGKPLPGYEQALANYNARKSSGNLVASASGGSSSSRSSSSGDDGGKKPTLLGLLFGGGADEEEDTVEAEVQVASRAPARSEAPAAIAEAPAAPAPVVEVAQLPTTNAPFPTPAPRARPQPVSEPVIAPEPAAPEPLVPSPQEIVEPQPAETILVAAVPTPSPRPNYTPPAPTAEPDFSTLVARLETIGQGEDARAALRAALDLPNKEGQDAVSDPIVTALAPVQPSVRPDPAPALAPVVIPRPSPAPVGKTSRLEADDRERLRRAASPGHLNALVNTTIGEKLSTGVVTTEKAAKPRALVATPDYDVAPLPVNSNRFGPASAREAMLSEPNTLAATRLQTGQRAGASNAFTGRAISFEQTGTVQR